MANVAINSESANIAGVMLTQQGSDPSAPSAGYTIVYSKSTGLYYRVNGGSAIALGDLANPMTTQDDLIVAGASGVPARLAKGTDGQVLTVDPSTHHLVWATPAAGSVATDAIWDAAGDLAVGSGANTAARKAIGTAYQLLGVNSGATDLAWGPSAVDWSGSLVLTQSGTVTCTIAKAIYVRLGPLTYIEVALTVTASGTTNNAVVVSGIPTDGRPANPGALAAIGAWSYYRNGSIIYAGSVEWQAADAVQFRPDSVVSVLGVTPQFAIANLDQMGFFVLAQV